MSYFSALHPAVIPSTSTTQLPVISPTALGCIIPPPPPSTGSTDTLQLPLASPVSSGSDPQDTESLNILGVLCAREAKLSPPGVSVYNGPRTSYFDVSDVIQEQRSRAKTPTSNGSRFGKKWYSIFFKTLFHIFKVN